MSFHHQPSSIKSLGNYKKVIHRVPVHTTHLNQTLFTLGIKWTSSVPMRSSTTQLEFPELYGSSLYLFPRTTKFRNFVRKICSVKNVRWAAATIRITTYGICTVHHTVHGLVALQQQLDGDQIEGESLACQS